MSKKIESTETIEKELPRVLVICFDNSDKSEGIYPLKEHPVIKGDHFLFVSMTGPFGETAKDWLSGHASKKFDALASFCAEQFAKKTAVVPVWLSSPEITRAARDTSISGIVLEREVENALRIQNNSGEEIPSFPKNEFLDRFVRNLS